MAGPGIFDIRDRLSGLAKRDLYSTGGAEADAQDPAAQRGRYERVHKDVSTKLPAVSDDGPTGEGV